MKDGMEPQTDDKTGNEPAQGPWVPYGDASKGRASTREVITPISKNSELMEQEGPLILPVKSLDTGVINVRTTV
jgi:hypothetical protein